jgi:hypothetical protein
VINYTIDTKKYPNFVQWLISNSQNLRIKYWIPEWKRETRFYFKDRAFPIFNLNLLRKFLFRESVTRNSTYNYCAFEVTQTPDCLNIEVSCDDLTYELYAEKIRSRVEKYCEDLKLQGLSFESIITEVKFTQSSPKSH